MELLHNVGLTEKNSVIFLRRFCTDFSTKNFQSGLDSIPKVCYNVDIKGKEIRTMTKMEMINRMIILGCIKEEDRNHWLRHTKDYIMKIYIDVVPARLEFLGRA